MAEKKDSLDALVEVMGVLRGENGCPWDKEQTHDSIKKYLIEETYEVLEAIDENDMHKLADELGDLLLQVVFHAQMAKERGDFDISDVISGSVQKMIRRHPHVFADEYADTSQEVLKKWEEIKSEENKEKKSILNVPKNLPALYRAQKLQSKAARVGFDWPDISGAWDKVAEELGELKEAEAANCGMKEELGDLLFSVVNIARFMEIDAEEALQEASDKFSRRFMQMEQAACRNHADLNKMSLAELDALWNKEKDNERNT